MFEFKHLNRALWLDTSGCFKPNLTTKVMIDGAIRALQRAPKLHESILEVGCGCGALTAYLLDAGHLIAGKRLGLSDISHVAVNRAMHNIASYSKNSRAIDFRFRIGDGLSPWKEDSFDFIISDISAVSDTLVGMTDWFENAPNNAGKDGLDNTFRLLHDFVRWTDVGRALLLPVLSLSNVEKLFAKMNDLNLIYEKVAGQQWPLPSDMVGRYRPELLETARAGHIQIEERFGAFIAHTACYYVVRRQN